VSREKKSLSFFLKLTKKFLQNHDEVELSGLGLAITTVVTITEILKADGLATVKAMHTALAEAPEKTAAERSAGTEAGKRGGAGGGGSGGNSHAAIPKAKIQVWIVRSDRFFELIAQERLDKTSGAPGNSKKKEPSAEGAGADSGSANAQAESGAVASAGSDTKEGGTA